MPGRSFSFISGTEEGEQPGCSQSSLCRLWGSWASPAFTGLPAGCARCSASPALTPLHPRQVPVPSLRPWWVPSGSFAPTPCAQSCALTLLAGLQLFHFQVMGELCKRNPAGLRGSIPPILCSPSLPLLPVRHTVLSLPDPQGTVAILEHQPQAALKIGNSGNFYVIKQPHAQDTVCRTMQCLQCLPF